MFGAVVVLEQIPKQFSRPESLTQSSTLIEYFLNDTSTIPVYKVHGFNANANDTIVDLSQVPSPLLAERAAMVLNTYIQLLYAPMAFAGNLPSGNLSLYGPEHIPAKGVDFVELYIYQGNRNTSTSACYPGDLGNPLFFGASANAVVTHVESLQG
ncbi:hypothetical protein PG993_014458 [Apiospora rasikravindrae]|uniref:Uncharacterized protein n=1 Tax=Apiospora rasikravindrae TaxID=990691 RepID=A0ABR1RMR2_9PEZI